MKRIALVFAALLIVLAMFAGCAKTQPPQEDKSFDIIKEKGVFVMGLDDTFAPMGFRDTADNIVGFDVDMATEVAKRWGVELKLQQIDWSAKEQELNTKNIDCIWNGFSIDESRKENHTLTAPYMDNNMAMVVRNEDNITSLDQLRGKKIGIQGGSSAVKALDAAAEFRAEVEVIEFKDNATALLDLETKGVDAVLMDDVVSRYYIDQSGKPLSVIEGTDNVISSEEYAVGLRKGEIQLRDALEATLREMAADGTLAEISTKWFGADVTKIK